MCGYRENPAKIPLCYQRCWLIWSSSSLLRVFVLDSIPPSHCSGPTSYSRLTSPVSWGWISKSLLQRLTPDWLTSFVLYSWFRRFSRIQLFVGSSCQNRQNGPSKHSDASQKCPRLDLFFSHPFTNTHVNLLTHTYTHIYIYIYSHIDAHYCVTKGQSVSLLVTGRGQVKEAKSSKPHPNGEAHIYGTIGTFPHQLKYTTARFLDFRSFRREVKISIKWVCFGLVLCHINYCRLLMPNTFMYMV